jgi:pimeloyl-ACP methyl ester carboxylesterase
VGDTSRLRVGGHELEAVWVGDRTPTSLVFLHEGLGSVSTWRDFPARVVTTTGLCALVYSRLGYGQSEPVSIPRPMSYMHDEGLVVLPELLDAAGIERCILVGHSDGGSIALVFAGAGLPQSTRCVGLVLEAPHVFVEDLSVASIAAARDAYTKGSLRERLARHHGANVDGAFLGWNGAWLDPRFLAWNIEEYLPRVTVPSLVIQGQDDPYGTLAQVDAIEQGAGAPVTRLVLPGCGHAPHRDRPEEVLAAIAAFVGRVV